MRVGIGHDTHRLSEGRPLILGGLRIDHPRGLVGHSDADVVCHAVADALLGAAGMGDIGEHYPDTDPKWRGLDSTKLLAEVVERIEQAGWHDGELRRHHSRTGTEAQPLQAGDPSEPGTAARSRRRSRQRQGQDRASTPGPSGGREVIVCAGRCTDRTDPNDGASEFHAPARL